MMGGDAAEKATVDTKLERVISILQLEQDKRVFWRPVSMFITWSAPECITSGQRRSAVLLDPHL